MGIGAGLGIGAGFGIGAGQGLGAGLGVGAGRSAHAVGESGEVGFVGGDPFEGIGGIDHVLREAIGQLGEFNFDGLGARFVGVGEVGAVAAEFVDGLGDVAGAGVVEVLGGVAFGEGFEGRPEGRVVGDGGEEGADLGVGSVVGGAEVGVAEQAFEVFDEAKGEVEFGGGVVEGAKGGFVGERGGALADGFESGAGEGDVVVDGRFDVLGAYAVEGEAVVEGEQGVG